MSSASNKLNLRPHERRLIALVVLVLFVVLNIWLIFPRFSEWGLTQSRQERARKTYESYRAEIAKIPAYQVKLRELESAGSSVVPDEQELDLVRTVDAQARMNRLNVITSDPRPKQTLGTQTNKFFEEQYVTLHVTSDTEALVNFLVSLTSTNSLIRVKNLSLKPADTAVTRLDANMTVVASYQRRPPTRTQPSATVQPAATPKTTNLAAAPKPSPSRALPKTNAPPAPASVPSRARLTNHPATRP